MTTTNEGHITMYIDPEIRRLLETADPDTKDFSEMTPAEARAAMVVMGDSGYPRQPVAVITDHTVHADGFDIPIRLYRPDTSPSGPLLVFFHGGGWEIGSIDTLDATLRRLANDSGVSILSTDYRLSPEHPFPAGLNDCYAALDWARTNDKALGFRPSCILVGGDSSGANLAAAVAQMNRDLGAPMIDHQLLIYPVVSRAMDTDSCAKFADGYFLTRSTMAMFWQLYVGDESPKYADLNTIGDLTCLPPATVFTCGLDVLSDEGDAYANDLAAAGIEVTHIRAGGLLHGIWHMETSARRAYQFGLDIAGALRRAVSTPTHNLGE